MLLGRPFGLFTYEKEEYFNISIEKCCIFGKNDRFYENISGRPAELHALKKKHTEETDPGHLSIVQVLIHTHIHAWCVLRDFLTP